MKQYVVVKFCAGQSYYFDTFAYGLDKAWTLTQNKAVKMSRKDALYFVSKFEIIYKDNFNIQRVSK